MLHDVFDKAFAHFHHVLGVHEGHFQVDLGEFRLTVRPEVFVPEAAGKLDVPVKAGDHQELLVDLGRLGQGVEAAVVDTGGNHIVSCPFGGGLHEHGSLNLDEAVVGEVIPGGFDDFCPHHEVFLELRTAEVQIAVAEPQFLVGIGLVGDVEGRSLGFGQDPQLGDEDLHFAGGEVGVDAFPAANGTLRHEDVFRADVLCFFDDSTVGGIVEDQLDDSGAVPKVNEDQFAFVTLFLGEAAYHDFLADVLNGNFPAVAGALQSSHRFCHMQYNLSGSIV